MSKIKWSAPVPDAEAYKRAGGRRRYNAQRQVQAELRRVQVAQLLLQGLGKSEIARRLGVSPSTISRDYAVLVQRNLEAQRCPLCGARLNPSFHEGVALCDRS